MAQRHLPALLIIMDGCGLAPADGENAVAAAKTPFLDGLYEKYPHTTLGASGEDVGLPDGQMGNSEVGHLNIGAGRIVFQELSRINNAIKDGSIAKNEVFVKAMDDVKAEGKTLHLMGLMSPGGVHSHMNHVEALVKMAAQHGVKTVRVHAFMDGRDVDPQSGAGYMSEFCAFLAKISEETGCDARVATVSGRYWAMDRDNRWERIQRAYDVMVNASDADVDPVAGIKAYYEKDPRGDEFVEPFAAHNEGIHEGDAAIFFNFRPDRARQMTRVFTDKEFDGFEREQIKLSHFVTMTEYDPTELLERGRRLHDRVVERVDDAPSYAQCNLADEGYTHVRCPHIEQTSQAHGHERHEQGFKVDQVRRQAERDHGAQHRAHTTGRREPAHPFDTDVQNIAVEERLQRIEGTVAKVRKENNAEQQGEDAVGKDCLDAGREGDARRCVGVGTLAGLV